MANPFSNFNFNSPSGQNFQTPPMFLQPQGNVYIINNSLEVANVPMGTGVSAAVCPSESLVYLKMYQNGAPAMMAYKLTPYEPQPKPAAPTEEDFSAWKQKISALEQKVQELSGNGKGGKFNELL